MKLNVKRITTIGMLCAIALVVVTFIRIPVVMFLKYEPKDVIITIGGFMLGPMARRSAPGRSSRRASPRDPRTTTCR